MKTYRSFIGGLALSLAISGPAFSQGLGVGLGAGSQTKVGVGGGAGGGVGAGSRTEVHAKTSADVKAGRAEPKSEGQPASRGQLGIGTRIESNPQLAARVQGMLPSGTSMNDAAAGFRNEGQFLAALHASKNLNIPFEDLKAQMTANHAGSLGAAIRQCRPGMSDSQAKEEGRKAESEARLTAKSSAKVKGAVKK